MLTVPRKGYEVYHVQSGATIQSGLTLSAARKFRGKMNGRGGKSFAVRVTK